MDWRFNPLKVLSGPYPGFLFRGFYFIDQIRNTIRPSYGMVNFIVEISLQRAILEGVLPLFINPANLPRLVAFDG